MLYCRDATLPMKLLDFFNRIFFSVTQTMTQNVFYIGKNEIIIVIMIMMVTTILMITEDEYNSNDNQQITPGGKCSTADLLSNYNAELYNSCS